MPQLDLLEWLQPDPDVAGRPLWRLKREMCHTYTQFGLPRRLAATRRYLNRERAHHHLGGHMRPQAFNLAAYPAILRRTNDLLGLEFVGFGQKLEDVGFMVGDRHQTDFGRGQADRLAQRRQPLVAFFVGNWTLLGALGASLRLRASPDLLVKYTERQTQRCDGQGRMHHQAALSTANWPQTAGCRMMGVVKKGGVLDGQNERMDGHAFECALLMRQQNLGRECV